MISIMKISRTLKFYAFIISLLYLALVVSQLLVKNSFLKQWLFSKSSAEGASPAVTNTNWVQSLPSKKSLCSNESEFLLGRQDVNLDDPLVANPVPNKTLQVRPGGSWSPKDCLPTRKVAILVPYRGRPKQLTAFMNHIHPILQRQRLEYTIFVIEQVGKTKFNKGAIYNIGFNKTLGYDDYDCYIFHDVDLLCENDRNYYGCPESPMHMCPAINNFKYKLPYPGIVGGVQAFKKEDYFKVNGYSNMYWGWGVEDDNLYQRIIRSGLKVKRPSIDVGRYKMNWRDHYRSDGWNPENGKVHVKKKYRHNADGLNSMHKLKFKIEERFEPHFTHILIDLQRQ